MLKRFQPVPLKMRFNRAAWPILVLVSGIPRILGAFFLPNGFGDAYVYIHDIGSLSTKISTGTFRLTDLFGFWLPLYQLIAAVLNLLIRNGFYSGKLVSAVFGIGVCLFVYAVTFTLTGSRKAAALTFLLIALNPLHIFYSASAMTDIPHAFFVLGALYFVLKKKWAIAAIFAALAGATRVESWMFIALIPLIQILRERRVSIVAVLVMIVPPLFWFYISWKATGDWLACFKQRQQYLEWLLMMNPAIARFSVINILRDGATLLISSDIAVLIASFIAAWFVFRQLLKIHRQKLSEEAQMILPPVVFFFAFFSLLLVAYLMHQQPIIFPRYGLILFTLGLPILAWTFFRVRQQKPSEARRLLIGTVVILSFDASIQFACAVGTINQYRAQREVADYLRDHFDPKSNARIFCDEGTVKVLSGIPEERFVTSSGALVEAERFSDFLTEKRVEYLVFVSNQSSIPNRLFPDLEYGKRYGPLEPVMNARTRFLPTEIWLYRVTGHGAQP
jgi:Gpi18-like mannosyltransferase